MRSPTILIAAGVTMGLAALVCGAKRQTPEGAAGTRWEYRIESAARLSGIPSLGNVQARARTPEELEALDNDIAARMTDLGVQGWELVCIQDNRSFVFKRRIPPDRS